ncbi:M1 family aminopeptidase [Sporosalibacterium faouarense]|uniref:M1 family aminopeptidase n=1 Tax=Sporosalibacterium faouarense TaxID=516123 RepID=UPI00141CF199|nr:M1 family aminopeptidase [Sporosalibacterium faouarense]MTI48694.1 M1 family metallopeptidase [Bacillota bacterium]
MNNNHYEFELSLDVKKERIHSKVEIIYFNSSDDTKEINFYLHEEFKIINVKAADEYRSIIDYSFKKKNDTNPFLPEANILTIYFDKEVKKNENIILSFEYEGKIGTVSEFEINRVTSDWVELGLYTPWFPLDKNMRLFTYNMKLSVDNEYSVVGNGKTEKSENSWIIKNPQGDFDCVILASKDLKVKQVIRDKINVKLYYTDLIDKGTVRYTLKSTQGIIVAYSDIFGKIDNQEMKIVYAKRKKGGGYARKDFIVLSSRLDDNISSFKSLAHELAHLWWKNAPTDTWEDWLNESFAEYSALLAIKKELGEKHFIELIKSKQESIEGLPSIKGIQRDHEKAYSVLYDKGCILLYRLENKIGHDRFKLLFMLINEEKVDSTEKFLSLLSKVTDKKIVKWFEKELIK